ncbi:MAG: AI-2E family transporter [Alphaproteobacteria bacterium]|nr:AI-2E family transporter [Alphaproteobacteria bacterium]MDX5368615.1 AI-2E family transporter [Alphaproteobacteria bacterium]MDX5463360.1 AI-2E family transporter [Alphaproteobacteria bacterium]
MSQSQDPSADVRHRQASAASIALALYGLLAIAVLYTLYVASDFFIPVTAAIVLNLLLTPVTRAMMRWFIPPPIGAALVILALSGGLAAGFVGLSQPVAEWMERMPQISAELQYKLHALREPVDKVRKASEEVEQAASGGGDQPEEVVIKTPGLLERATQTVQTVGLHLVATLVLLYFLLAVGEMFTEKLVRVMPSFADKRKAFSVVRQVEKDVSRYLLTVTIINICLGFVIGTGLYLLGLENAVLWGAAAAVLNFIPYFGALLGILLVGLASILAFPTLGQAMLGPAIYLAANAMESQFITPMALSRRLTMNPVVLFLSVTFWGYIWGVAGALLAVPILVAVKVVCDHVEALKPFGQFMSGREGRGT